MLRRLSSFIVAIQSIDVYQGYYVAITRKCAPLLPVTDLEAYWWYRWTVALLISRSLSLLTVESLVRLISDKIHLQPSNCLSVICKQPPPLPTIGSSFRRFVRSSLCPMQIISTQKWCYPKTQITSLMWDVAYLRFHLPSVLKCKFSDKLPLLDGQDVFVDLNQEVKKRRELGNCFTIKWSWVVDIRGTGTSHVESYFRELQKVPSSLWFF